MDRDRVSDYLAQWAVVRPDLDVAPMGVLGRISRSSDLIARTTRTYFASRGLQSWEFDVLATLRRTGAPFTLTPGQLAESMMVGSAAITHRLSALEAKDLLTRRTDPGNRRNVLVTLTETGLALVDDVVAGHLDAEREVLAVLSEKDQDRLARILQRLLAASGDHSHDSPERQHDT